MGSHAPRRPRLLHRSGAVTVAINCRFGVEGFLPIDGAPTNLGLRDMIAAMRWVQRNIGRFGGSTQGCAGARSGAPRSPTSPSGSPPASSPKPTRSAATSTTSTGPRPRWAGAWASRAASASRSPSTTSPPSPGPSGSATRCPRRRPRRVLHRDEAALSGPRQPLGDPARRPAAVRKLSPSVDGAKPGKLSSRLLSQYEMRVGAWA
ncbi:carboxylesterase family protein [Amycolatopsis bartoniae]|nr:carboxylesterase family protein [Amycolatopsis bartoniae]